MLADRIADLTGTRARLPERIQEVAAARQRPASLLDARDRLVLIAADHPARGALGVGGDRLAMANRGDLLARLCTALQRPGVGGVMGSADVLEDLLLLGALEGKVVIGSMNRGGLADSAFELDDRFTGYDSETISRMGFEGGKMLLRIDLGDPATSNALQACAQAVTSLAGGHLMAMIEPFMSRRVDSRLRNDLTADAMISAISVASGLGVSSAYTWLKIPVTEEMERVMAATTLPALLLGGDLQEGRDPFAGWRAALQVPGVKGIVAGRSLLYPPDDNVARAVDTVVGFL